MNKIKKWTTILSMFIILTLIFIYLIDREVIQQKVIVTNISNYKSNYSDTAIYNQEGALNYRLIAQNIEYFPDKKASWFTHPIMTIFDSNKVSIWLIKSDNAQLTKNRILYLYGHVEVNALTTDISLRKITTDNAKINLITQDVLSQDSILLYGSTFNSSGSRMHWNLQKKNAELTKNVRTLYKIQNKQTQL